MSIKIQSISREGIEYYVDYILYDWESICIRISLECNLVKCLFNIF